MCDVNSCNVSLLLFMALWVLISATIFRRAVLVLWHAFLFLGLGFFSPLFFFFAWWPPLLFLVRNFELPYTSVPIFFSSLLVDCSKMDYKEKNMSTDRENGRGTGGLNYFMVLLSWCTPLLSLSFNPF
jgi:hypothetical protein